MLIVANWKAYVGNREEAKKLLATAKRLAGKTRKLSLVLAPSFPHLGLLAPGNRSKVKFAAQDLSETSVGPATGEVQGEILYDIGARYVIIGHSERRALGETDALIAEKAKRAFAAGLIPILCVGERERDEDAQYLAELRAQLSTVYAALSPRDRSRVIVAYEPVWAIGRRAEDAITPHDLAEMVLYIRKVLADHMPPKTAKAATILYGGSVEPGNARSLVKEGGVEGLLVGRASVESATFTALVKSLR